LAELRFLRARPDGAGRDAREEGGGALRGPVVVRADDLRQSAQLLQGVALGDPLRAEGDVHGATGFGQMLAHVGRGARVDGAPEDDESAVPEVRGDLVDGLFEDRHRWPQELVDGCPDDHDQGVRALDHGAVGAKLEPPGGEDLAQQVVNAVLQERHVASSDAVQGP